MKLTDADNAADGIFFPALEQNMMGAVLINENDEVMFFNPAAEKLWGYKREEVIGNNIDMLIPRDLRPAHPEYIRHNREGGKARVEGMSRELQLEKKDGSKIWTRFALSKVSAEGKVYYLALVRDASVEMAQKEQTRQLIIADEPTTALDVTVQLQVLRLLKHKARASGTAVLFISHDMAVVSQLCDSVYVMYAGSVIESGVTADVIHHPRHPYTIGLLQCAPEHGVPRQLLPAIPGTVPNLTHLPEGCAFRDRCYAAGAQCENVPALTACGDNNQRCACWYPQQEVISV